MCLEFGKEIGMEIRILVGGTWCIVSKNPIVYPSVLSYKYIFFKQKCDSTEFTES